MAYQLDDQLRETGLETGPKSDSLNCSYIPTDPCPLCPSNSSLDIEKECPSLRSPTSSINQLLVLNDRVDKPVIIACSTLFYGSCEMIDPSTFIPVDYIYNPVVPNDPEKSVVGFFGTDSSGNNLLFVGASYSTRGVEHWRNMVNLISIRDGNTMDLQTNSSSFVRMLPAFTESFQVEFIHGFYHNNYAYFLARHPESSASNIVSTYIIRICGSGKDTTRSFVEIKMACQADGISYSLLKDAVLKPSSSPGDNGTSSMAIYAVFSSSDSDQKSAVCLYDMNTVEQEFLNSILKCFNGEEQNDVHKGPEYIVETAQCVKMVQ